MSVPSGEVVDLRHRESPPKLAKIVTAWSTLSRSEFETTFPRNEALMIGWGEPFCFRCGWLAPIPDMASYPADMDQAKVWDRTWNSAGGWLDRAHLQDHRHGGGVDPLNLVPMCLLCHERQPECATREAGISFVNNDRGSKIRWMVQIFTDYHYQGRRNPSREEALRWMLRAQGAAGETYAENISQLLVA